MSTAELKRKLIAQIKETDNDDLLTEISTMLFIEAHSVNGVYQLSAEEIEAINEGLEQIKNGQWLSDAESNKRVEEWLNKND
jgi:predicted transcriptional regulator